MYTVEQIENAIEGRDGTSEIEEQFKRPNPARYSGYEYPTTEGWSDVYGDGFIVIDGNPVDYEVVATTGGMDKGSNASVTFRIGDQYFTKHGYYASHYGYDWDGELEEVVPKTVEVVRYVSKD